MENTEKFQQTVAEYVWIHGAGSGGSSVGYVPPYDDGIPEHEPTIIRTSSWKESRARTKERRKQLISMY